MKKLLLLLTLLLWLPLAQANEAEYDRGYDAYDSKDYKTAYAIFKPLARQGHAGAQYNLGNMYDYEQGVPKNYAEAFKWYSKAAKQGHAYAQKRLDFIYKYRDGPFPKNYDKTTEWYRQAATQEDVYAQWNLGEIYQYGQGVPKNYAEAFKWYSKAAAAAQVGDPAYAVYQKDAQEIIAQWYRDGKGVSNNNIYAYMWFSIADTNGADYLEGEIEDLTEDMFSEELNKAQALATKCWDSKYQDCSE